MLCYVESLNQGRYFVEIPDPQHPARPGTRTIMWPGEFRGVLAWEERA